MSWESRSGQGRSGAIMPVELDHPASERRYVPADEIEALITQPCNEASEEPFCEEYDALLERMYVEGGGGGWSSLSRPQQVRSRVYL